MSFIRKYGAGKSAANREQNLRKSIVEAWSNFAAEYDEKGNVIKEGVDFLKDLNGHVRDNIALLFENQAHYIAEATDSSSSGSFEVVAFPMVRRIFSKLLANEIVSVQAMTQPSGQLFYFYPQIADRVEGTDDDGRPTSSHTSMVNEWPSCIGANCPATTFANCRSLYDRFYNDGLFDYSKGKSTLITASGSPVVFTDGCVAAASGLTLADDGSVRHVKFAVSGFNGINPGTSPGHTARLSGRGGMGLEIDTQDFLSSFTAVWVSATPLLDPNGKVIYKQGDVIEHRTVSMRYASSLVEHYDYCAAEGVYYVELSFVHPNTNCDACQTYDNMIGAASGTTIAPTDIAFAWRRYEDLEYSGNMGEVSFTIKKVPVSATPRKLKARWSPELARDVQAYHSIDAEAELTALLSEQVAMEVDREILLKLKKGAAWRLNWDFMGWKLQGSQKYTEKEWKQTLITRINQVSAQIHKKTLRGGANFIVVSTEVSALLDDLEAFAVSNNSLEDDTYNLGIKRIGTLNGRFTVYVDPYATPHTVLIGHKGTSILDTGFIFAPYVPLELTPPIMDPVTLTMVKGIQTRYAAEMVNNNFYGTIRIFNLPTFDANEFR